MSWLNNYSTTNTFRSIYINGFMDISGGRLQTRSVTDGHLLIAGDASLNGNLYVGGDISWNPNSLANNSIPSSAIIGGAVGATGPAGPGGSSTEVMFLTVVPNSTQQNSNVYNLTNWDVHGSADMLSEARALRAYASGNYGLFVLNFKPGVYRVSINLRWFTSSDIFYGFDVDQSGILDPINPHERFHPVVIDSGENQYTSRTFFVSSQCNFYLYSKNTAYLAVRWSGTPQLTFERIGDINVTSTNVQSLSSLPSGTYSITSSYIYGGIHFTNAPADHIPYDSVLNSPTYAIPPIMVGTTHSSHNPSSSGWVHAIDPTTTSSVEVASFHSDADLSLNKRLFVGEDVSLNGNLYVGGDISWNPTSLANNSIPSTAIIGGASGPADILLLDATNYPSSYNSYGLVETDYKMSGSTDMLASPYTKRFNLTTGGKYYRGFSMLFKPGVYTLSVQFTINTVASMYFTFDKDNDREYLDDPATLYGTDIAGGEAICFKRTYSVEHNTNFFMIERTSTTVHNRERDAPQFKFERVGHVEPQGSDATLDIVSGATLTDTKLIEGGIYWSSNTSNPPASGYEPSNHTSHGGTNKWAVVEQATGTVQNVLGWVHRISHVG